MDHDMESSPTTPFGINSSMATGGSANAAMVGQTVDSVQASSLEMSPGASSESTLETAQRTSQSIQSEQKHAHRPSSQEALEELVLLQLPQQEKSPTRDLWGVIQERRSYFPHNRSLWSFLGPDQDLRHRLPKEQRSR